MTSVDILDLTIPLTPPSVNHYVKHTRDGRHYVTEEAKAFKEAVVILNQGRYVVGNDFRLEINVYLAKGQRLDWDNAAKVCGDALEDAGVFDNGKKKKSDGAVKQGIVTIARDPSNPRTFIRVRAI